MRDTAHNLKTVTALAPAVYTADTNGLTIDRQGFESLTFALAIGAGGDTFTSSKRRDFIIEHSDDGTTWSAVGADNVIGLAADAVNGIVQSVKAAHASATTDRFGYVGGTIGQKRYVRCSLDVVGTHSAGTPIAITAILGHPHWQPVS